MKRPIRVRAAAAGSGRQMMSDWVMRPGPPLRCAVAICVAMLRCSVARNRSTYSKYASGWAPEVPRLARNLPQHQSDAVLVPGLMYTIPPGDVQARKMLQHFAWPYVASPYFFARSRATAQRTEYASGGGCLMRRLAHNLPQGRRGRRKKEGQIEPLDTVVRVTPSPRLAQEWATVLAAASIRHRVETASGGWALIVAGHDGARAGGALDAYDEEERPQPSVAPAPPDRSAIGLGVAVAFLLLGFFLVTGPRDMESAWFARGSASAERILAGEVWRTVTALTLHSDLAHVLGNALACVVLIPPVVQALGPGTGLWALLLAGAIGNGLTVLVHGAPHDSVGASTLVFAAIGVLAAQAFLARWRGRAAGRRA